MGEPASAAEPTPVAAPAPAEERLFTRALALLIAAAALLKLLLIANSFCTADCETWFFFARHAMRYGLHDAYESIGPPLFNHPPLATAIETGSLACGKWLGSVVLEAKDHYPGSPFFWIRFPSLVADLVCLVAIGPLLRARFGVTVARRMIGALALSPLTFLVGVWHGNTELIWVLFVLLGALVLEWPFPVTPGLPRARTRALIAGALVGVGAGIKLPAVVALAPLGLVAERERRGAAFALGFVLTALPLYIWGLVGGGYPFVECVLGYAGTVTAYPWPPGRTIGPLLGERAGAWFLHHGHLVVGVAASAVSLAFARRGRAGNALAAAYAAVVLVLPVFGMPYLAWIAVFVALLGWRGALLVHVAAFTQAAIAYQYPITKFLTDEERATMLPVAPTLPTWGLLLAVVAGAVTGRRLLAPKAV